MRHLSLVWPSWERVIPLLASSNLLPVNRSQEGDSCSVIVWGVRLVTQQIFDNFWESKTPRGQTGVTERASAKHVKGKRLHIFTLSVPPSKFMNLKTQDWSYIHSLTGLLTHTISMHHVSSSPKTGSALGLRKIIMGQRVRVGVISIWMWRRGSCSLTNIPTWTSLIFFFFLPSINLIKRFWPNWVKWRLPSISICTKKLHWFKNLYFLVHYCHF